MTNGKQYDTIQEKQTKSNKETQQESDEGIIMNINELTNYKIKICKTSITAKDENGKTRGVVRNVEKLKDMQLNKQFEFSNKLRKIGLFGKIKLDNIIVKDGKMYIFENLYTRQFISDIDELIKHDTELIAFSKLGEVIPVQRILK